MANHRISENTIIREFSTVITEKFWAVGSQYVHADENSWYNAVWTAGEYAKCRNRSYTNNGLYPLPGIDKAKEMQANKFEIMLRQGFRFDPEGVIALHFILLDLNNNKILASQYLTESDFHVTADRLLIDGSFWMVSTTVYIPNTTGLLCAAITEITAEDINNETGFLYNFTSPSEPLTDKKELVETIKASAVIDENFYLTLSLYTEEYKTVEQALKDYIGREPSDLKVEYKVNYGNEIFGYKDLSIANETNYFAPIKIGLDLSGWDINNEEADSQILKIQVSTNITYDNSLMYRETTVTTDVKKVLNPIINDILESQKAISLYPVNVSIENKIEQTVVETNIDRQVVQVLQPMFCEMIKDSIVIENKRITIENLNQPAYLVIAKTKKNEEQTLKNDITVDGKYYFDLSKLTPPSENTTYTLYDEQQRMILGRGYVYTKYVDDVVPSTDNP